MTSKDEIEGLLGKAAESIKAAELLLSEEHCGFAAGRAYYAMFYIAEALLLCNELSFSKHSGVIAAFGEQYVKKGVFDKKYHRYLIDAYEYREIGDYEPIEKIPRKIAEQVILNAKEFLMAGRDYLLKT